MGAYFGVLIFFGLIAVLFYAAIPVILFFQIRNLVKKAEKLEAFLARQEGNFSSLPAGFPEKDLKEDFEKGEIHSSCGKKEEPRSPAGEFSMPEAAYLPPCEKMEQEKEIPVPAPLPEKMPQSLSPFEKMTHEACSKIWNWFIVGEEFRKGGVNKEFAVASTWLLRGGFLLLLFGIGYLVKFSHDRNLFPPALRLVTVGIFASGAIFAGCRMMEGKLRKLGITFAGGGFASLYFVVLAGMNLYKLLPPMAAFSLLVILTLGGLALSLWKNTMLLALLAVSGGYLAPVLTSSGSRNLTGLFLYLTILSSCVLLTAKFRSWRVLHILSFLFLWTIFFLAEPFRGDYSFCCAWLFGSIFFLLFSLQLLFQAWHGKKCVLPELLLHLINTSIYAGTFLPLLIGKKGFGYPVAGALTFILALYFFFDFCISFRKKEKDEGLILTLFLESMGFLALTFPLLCHRNIWVFAWSLQALFILYGARKVQSRALELIACILFGVAGGKLCLMDLFSSASGGILQGGFWDRSLSFISLSLALAGGFFILKKFPNRADADEKLLPPPIREHIFLYGAYTFFFIFLWDELAGLNWGCGSLQISLRMGVFLVSFFLFLPIFLAKQGIGTWERVRKVQLILFIPAASYLLMVAATYSPQYRELVFPWHFLPFLFSFLLLAASGKIFHSAGCRKEAGVALITGGVSFFLYSSREFYALMKIFQGSGGADIALSILWMIYGLLLVWGGVKKEWKSIRFTGLGLFILAFFKIFFRDLAGSPPLYRIGGCLLCSAFLMAAAFFYLKKKEDSSGKG